MKVVPVVEWGRTIGWGRSIASKREREEHCEIVEASKALREQDKRTSLEKSKCGASCAFWNPHSNGANPPDQARVEQVCRVCEDHRVVSCVFGLLFTSSLQSLFTSVIPMSGDARVTRSPPLHSSPWLISANGEGALSGMRLSLGSWWLSY